MTDDDAELAQLLDEADRRLAQRSFLAFYERMTGFSAPRHIKAICKLLQSMEEDRCDRAMIFAPPRHGKRLADDTPMLTANRGWTTHGEIQVGDSVWHPSGKAVRVIGVFPPDQSDLLITFSNGEKIQCDADHLWTVWDRGRTSTDRYRKKIGKLPGGRTWETLSTAELVRRGVMVVGSSGSRGSRFRWQLPDCLGIDGQEIIRAMGPYTLGVWLGDGHTGYPRVTMGAADMGYVLAGIEGEGYVRRATYCHKTTGVLSAVFSNPANEKKGRAFGEKCPLAAHLHDEGVFRDKHIPQRWLTASRRQRLEILAGLMDTDGHCERDTGRCRIVTVMPKLAESIFDLCVSLGFRPYITTHQPDGISGRDGIISKQKVFTVGFQPHEPIPCRIPRKRPQQFAPRRHITIRSIERVAPKSCRCISVDAADGLYLAGRQLVPTHNTLLTSILFPAWLMGRRPETYIMSISHTSDYALQIGGKVRNLLKMPEWPFSDVGLSEDSQAKDRWRTRAGGEMNTFGALAGNQHGRAAEWLGMDDVVKGREMALSPDMRNKVWDNYIADMRTRLQGRRKQIMTFTRWHPDDPAGRILPEDWAGESGWIKDRQTGERWFVLCLPALHEGGRDVLGRKPGEWLWPEMFGEKQLASERARGGWYWSALYQQKPSPEEGLLFRSEHFQEYDPSKLDMTRLSIYGSSDYAVKEEAGKADPDWTVHLVWGVDPDMNLYLLDIWRGRTESDVWALAWIALVRKWKPVRWAEEGGVINLAVSPTLRRLMHEHQVYVQRTQLQSLVSKEARAQPLLSWCGLGRVFLPDRAKLSGEKQMHMNAMMQELMQFPGGKHDDTVDAATLMGRMLDRIQGGEARTVHKSPHRHTIHDAFKEHEEQLERRARR